MKILVIEDDELVRENLLDLLEAEKFQVLGAQNGVTGLLLAQRYLPNLIICDVMMPDLDGYGVFSQLQQIPSLAQIPFIFLTAKADRNSMREGMGLGADDYITKPFEPAELLQAITTRLAKYTVLKQQYFAEQKRAEHLQNKVRELQQFLETQGDLVKNLAQELRNPVSNMNLAIHMLRTSSDLAQRDRYLCVLQEECNREIALLNQVQELQALLTPENTQLLRQLKLLR